MISSNPLLGPQWEPVGHVLVRLLEDIRRGKMFSVQTYMKRFSLSPYDSPFIQAIQEEEFGRVQIELSANLQLNPPLSADEYRLLAFYGWTRPETGDYTYGFDDPEGNPNFVRFYDWGDDAVDIAEFLLTSLVGVCGMVEDDFWGFADADDADRVDALRKLGRLKVSEGNPDRVIFAMPGRHLELLELEDAEN